MKLETNLGEIYSYEHLQILIGVDQLFIFLLLFSDLDTFLKKILYCVVVVVVVISAHGEVVRSLLVEAHARGLTSGEFVFFCFMPYSQDEMFGSFEWQQGALIVNVQIKIAWWWERFKRFTTEIFTLLLRRWVRCGSQAGLSGAFHPVHVQARWWPLQSFCWGCYQEVKTGLWIHVWSFWEGEKVSLGGEKHLLTHEICGPGGILRTWSIQLAVFSIQYSFYNSIFLNNICFCIFPHTYSM